MEETISSKFDEAIATLFNLQNIRSCNNFNKIGFNDGRDLFNYIEKEEIRACTTCNACVEACPVLISPLEIILQLRRYEVLTESSGPPDWIPMYNALENNGSPWQMTIERDDWIKDLN